MKQHAENNPITHRSAKITNADQSVSTGVGRCFPFWQEVLGCYVVNTSAEDDSGKKKCALALEDYYECLHHKKEVRSSHRAIGNEHEGAGQLSRSSC